MKAGKADVVNTPRSQRSLVLAVSATVVCILQITALSRYVRRLSGDWVGIALYSVVVAALAISAIWSYVSWARTRGKRNVPRDPAN